MSDTTVSPPIVTPAQLEGNEMSEAIWALHNPPKPALPDKAAKVIPFAKK